MNRGGAARRIPADVELLEAAEADAAAYRAIAARCATERGRAVWTAFAAGRDADAARARARIGAAVAGAVRAVRTA